MKGTIVFLGGYLCGLFVIILAFFASIYVIIGDDGQRFYPNHEMTQLFDVDVDNVTGEDLAIINEAYYSIETRYKLKYKTLTFTDKLDYHYKEAANTDRDCHCNGFNADGHIFIGYKPIQQLSENIKVMGTSSENLKSTLCHELLHDLIKGATNEENDLIHDIIYDLQSKEVCFI